MLVDIGVPVGACVSVGVAVDVLLGTGVEVGTSGVWVGVRVSVGVPV